jgi:hypothetical protein
MPKKMLVAQMRYSGPPYISTVLDHPRNHQKPKTDTTADDLRTGRETGYII